MFRMAADLVKLPDDVLTDPAWLQQPDELHHLAVTLSAIAPAWNQAVQVAEQAGFGAVVTELDLRAVGARLSGFITEISVRPITDLWNQAIRGLWTGRDASLNTVYRGYLVLNTCYQEESGLQRMRTLLGEITWVLFRACTASGTRLLEVELFRPPPSFCADSLLMDSGVKRLPPMRRKVRALLDSGESGFVVDVLSLGFVSPNGERQPPMVCLVNRSDWTT